jgi:hypothetical protein
MRIVGASAGVLDVDSLDERNRDLVASHTRRYWADENPRPAIGDIVRLDPGGINSVRIAYLWTDGHFQPAGSGSFHLQPEALAYNGSLELPKAVRHLVSLSRPEWARCWIFHHGNAQPTHRLDVEIPRRVWVEDPEFAS